MENCIFKINCEDEGNGAEFFCKIPFLNTFNLLSILMTNNHVLEKDEIRINKIINLIMNNNQKSF